MDKLKDSSSLEKMIQYQIVDRGIHDPRVIEAIRRIPREVFFPPEGRERAFEDSPAPIGYGQTISQPYIVALMTQRLDIGPGHRVLEIGTGSGYQTAILAKLAGEVYSVERVKPLLDSAFERLLGLGLKNVHFKFGDGLLGWLEKGPFDRVVIGAAAEKVPEEMLMGALVMGGVAVLPVGSKVGGEDQMLMEVKRGEGGLVVEPIMPVRFVKMVAGVER